MAGNWSIRAGRVDQLRLLRGLVVAIDLREQRDAVAAEWVVLAHEMPIELDHHRVDVRHLASDGKTPRRQARSIASVFDEEQRLMTYAIDNALIRDNHVGDTLFIRETLH